LGYYRPGTYVFEGATRILPAALAQSGSAWDQLLWLIKTYVVGEPTAYLVGVPAILVRGLWRGAGLVALIGVFHVPTLLRWARVERTHYWTVTVVGLTAALLVLNTLLTANSLYANPMLAFVYAYAIAHVAGGR
jgi:hypothetical protein